jgi:biopolymer transport protein ExbB
MGKRLLGMAGLLWALSASAQAQAPGAAAGTGTWGEILSRGGPVMLVLAAMSLVTVFLIFYYLFTLRSELIVPSALLKQLAAALHQKDYDLMMRACEADGSPAAKVIAAGLGIHRRTKRNYALVRGALEDEGARQAGVLWQRIQYLQDIAVIAPMVGLLGTVIGMIQSFMGMQAQDAAPRPTVIADGVSMALVTTAAGLLLGIFAMIVYAAFRGRIHRLVGELETGCDRITVELLDTDPPA